MLIRKLWPKFRIYLLLAILPASIFAGYAAYWAFVVDTETVEMMRMDPRLRTFVVGMISLMTLFIYGWLVIALSWTADILQMLYFGSRRLWVAMSDEQTPLKIRIVQYYLPLAVSLSLPVRYAVEVMIEIIGNMLGVASGPTDWGTVVFGFIIILFFSGIACLLLMYVVLQGRMLVRRWQRS